MTPHDAFASAARRCGVEVQELTELADLTAAIRLWARVWRADNPDSLMPMSTLRALAHAGNYVCGAYRDGELIAASLAFFGDGHLHSHMTGVVPGIRAKGVGHVVKLHQRAWALQRGLREVHWTFDPLVRRNAYFNFQKLGAHAPAYLVDFYGPLYDGLNLGDPSDRLYVVWDLEGARAEAALRGELAEPAGERMIATPQDIESLREADPAEALRWRHKMRDELHGALNAGYRIAGVTRDGNYVLAE
jgi:predicted GNAT superfamily acetyltransferase